MFSRLCEWLDNPETGYLYYLPFIGGVKSYRVREQTRIVGHATGDVTETPYRKRHSSLLWSIGLEAGKISILIAAVYAAMNSGLSLYAILFGSFSYYVCSYAESRIYPIIFE